MNTIVIKSESKELKFSDLKFGDIFKLSLCGYPQPPMIKIRTSIVEGYGVVNAISLYNGDRHVIHEDDLVDAVFTKVTLE